MYSEGIFFPFLASKLLNDEFCCGNTSKTFPKARTKRGQHKSTTAHVAETSQFHPVPVASHGFPLGPCEQLPVQLPQYLGAAWGLSQLVGFPWAAQLWPTAPIWGHAVRNDQKWSEMIRNIWKYHLKYPTLFALFSFKPLMPQDWRYWSGFQMFAQFLAHLVQCLH